MPASSNQELPHASSPNLHLAHPTPDESLHLWRLTANDWKGALTESQYLEEYAEKMHVPLARDNGITQWVLVDRDHLPDNRPMLASCQTYRKKALISDADGNSSEVIAHGIASVYCDPQFRGRGYASRMLSELSKILPNWQADGTKSIASVLFSDIGPELYRRSGWNPFPSYHLEFKPVKSEGSGAAPLHAEDLAALCKEDEALLRASLSKPTGDNCRKRFAIIPDHDHIVWHQFKEEFEYQKLFGKAPSVKGATAGTPGNRVWAIWLHRIYRHPDVESTIENILYMLRFVFENPSSVDETTTNNVRAVLQAAQKEAEEWGLHKVSLWSPSETLEKVIKQADVPYEGVTRTQKSIPCLHWFGEGHGTPDSLEWVLNEKYAWC